jgi:sugar/nucleoside kinase (ribokinase family)
MLSSLMQKPFTISGAGCCLVDRIYPHIEFHGEGVKPYLSRQDGDGGLHPGRLVFAESFEQFSGKGLQEAIEEMAGSDHKPVMNVGGPSIVALIHASQLLAGSNASIRYYGTRGKDPVGDFLEEKILQTPVALGSFRQVDRSTASTLVLSDPGMHEGQGERAFINDIGSSWEMYPGDLDRSFFERDIAVFGGTALVPHLHDTLSDLLEEAKAHGSLTLVNTVYDFRNEFARPGMRWPLGDSDRAYSLTDLLITDLEEAQKLSGRQEAGECASFFLDQGVGALLITRGTGDTLAWSSGGTFGELPLEAFPVSALLVKELRSYQGGDTTGCGDNFVGGVLASLALQQMEKKERPDLVECLKWGTVSGGYCCFQVGGTYLESRPGEKLEKILPYLEHYHTQLYD